MSGLCIINFKRHNLTFEAMNELAEKLMYIALQNHIAIFFNSHYRRDLIDNIKMKNYFVMSDSFIYRNCNFLDVVPIVESCIDSGESVLHEEPAFRDEFMKKFHFFDLIIQCIFQYNVDLLEIYISESGCVSKEEDFEVVRTSSKLFLLDLFNSLVDMNNGFNYEFPNAKFVISKD